MKAKLEFLFGLAIACLALYGLETHSEKKLLLESIVSVFFLSLCIKENMKRRE
jgi:hypothetical protein